MDKEKEQGYVTNGKLQKVVFEIKNEINEMDRKHEKAYDELRYSNIGLTQTMDNLNENITNQTAMMKEWVQESKQMAQEIIDIKLENKDRDNDMKDLKSFKEEASKHISGKFKEVMVFLGVLVGALSGIAVAIIQIAPHFFQ